MRLLLCGNRIWSLIHSLYVILLVTLIDSCRHIVFVIVSFIILYLIEISPDFHISAEYLLKCYSKVNLNYLYVMLLINVNVLVVRIFRITCPVLI